MNRDGSNYFRQGAICRTESGNLLEMEENFMIFLEVYNQSGERTGTISFTVGGNSLQSAPFLKSGMRAHREDLYDQAGVFS
ncbi:MAG: hypothetical protein K1X70_09700 [Leptospirales bacterium]|nr:hypothetical protein [Leptospirales bacterium]